MDNSLNITASQQLPSSPPLSPSTTSATPSSPSNDVPPSLSAAPSFPLPTTNSSPSLPMNPSASSTTISSSATSPPTIPTEFPKFLDLPRELRYKIWNYWGNDTIDRTPRIFEVKLVKSIDNSIHPSSSYGRSKLFELLKKSSPTSIPFPQVNKESRDELLRRFNRMHLANSVIYMDVKIDSIYFSMVNVSDEVLGGPHTGSLNWASYIMAEKEVWAKVENVTIPYLMLHDFLPPYKVLNDEYWLPFEIEELKTLAICIGDDFDVMDAPDGLVETYSIDEDTVAHELWFLIATSQVHWPMFTTMDSFGVELGYSASATGIMNSVRNQFPQHHIPQFELKYATRDGKTKSANWARHTPWDLSIY